MGVNALAALKGDPRVFGVISKRVPFALDALLGAFGGYEGGGAAALRRFVLARYDRIVVNSVGEGLINGALTARIGVAAMEVCRPLAFQARPRPGVAGLIRGAFKGLDGAP